MSKHTTISPAQAADRLAIRELVEAYAHCADRRDANGQMSLFTEDAHFVVYMNAKDKAPSLELHSREALASVFADLNKYDVTTHFVGQNTIFTLSADRGTGETYCLAHHVTVEGGKRKAALDARLTAIPRHVRQGGQRVAICRALALRGLAGGARTRITATVSFIGCRAKAYRQSRCCIRPGRRCLPRSSRHAIRAEGSVP
jgi:ketosteroid isomerase-like protein